VPYFDGNNGGATFQGVTKDSIRIVFYNDRTFEGELNEPWKPSDDDQCQSAAAGPYECQGAIRTMKAHLKYFAERYMTYDREVRVVAQKSSGNVGGTCASRQADADRAIREWEPFAVVSLVQGNQHCYAAKMSKERIPVFGLNEDLPEESYEAVRPYAFGFMPTQEVQSSWTASFICRKLVGGNARFSDDVLVGGLPRKIGFIRPQGESRGSELPEAAAMLVSELKRQCDYEFDIERYYEARQNPSPSGAAEAPNIISLFKQERVTTIVCYCIPVGPENTAPTMLRTATGANYFPEWVWDQASAMDRGQWQRVHGDRSQPAMGTTYFWYSPAFREQFHYQAYLSQEPGTEASTFWSYRYYHLYLNLFEAIQAAGPKLTPETVEQGMFTFNFLIHGDPRVPMGGYGPYGPNAISNYTFVDTGMAWWWDPNGTPPGGTNREGCMRAVRGGIRAYPGDGDLAWPPGDADLFNESDPCTQDLYKIADPSTSTSV